ncbi:MAG: cysteine--tRNA ligase [Bacillota bacterium]
MAIRVYNTLTRRHEEFVPLVDGEVKMYVCGPTVYAEFHIGNARVFTVFDAIRRYLGYRGFKVTYVQNFTDIDDKIINRAQALGMHPAALAELEIGHYFRDADTLGIKRADVHPRATEEIGQIIDLACRLIDAGYAYVAAGDVYFSVNSFRRYGELSGQDPEQLEAGARVDVTELKRHHLDFALWKAAKPGEPAWPSPWGPGRPGWHIECSAMARRYLGETIDIHAGGPDLIFPHHENEKAQSEALTGAPFARYWLHVGFLSFDGEKMSKSLGNVLTIPQLTQTFDPEAIRFFLLSSHYRSPLSYSEELLAAAATGLGRLYNAIGTYRQWLTATAKAGADPADEGIRKRLQRYRQRFIEAMDDDFNTADAIAVLFELTRDLNITLTPDSSRDILTVALDLYAELGGVLGLLGREDGVLGAEVERLLELRQQARQARNWAEADAIRDRLAAQGIVLEDTPAGVRWKRAPR